MTEVRALAALALVACGGATPAPPRPASPHALMFRLEMDEARAETPARSDHCWRAIDALGERAGRDRIVAPDEVTAGLAACAPADVAAAERVFARREARMTSQPTHDDFERFRAMLESCPECMGDYALACRTTRSPASIATWEWQFVVDGESSSWLHAERCCAVLMPRRTAAVVLEQARKWVAAGRVDRVEACLEGCVLAPATRAELERLARQR